MSRRIPHTLGNAPTCHDAQRGQGHAAPRRRNPQASVRSTRVNAAARILDVRPLLHNAFRCDVPASLVVFLVSLPLSIGIAVASGAPVIAGLIAAIVG
jgi:sulfate permease family protein